MKTHSTNEFKPGLKLIIDGDPCVILEHQFVKPGKGQAFTRIKIRNLKTTRVLEKTYRSGESLEAADVLDREMQYLYNDGETWHFMDQDSYEQYPIPARIMADSAKWLNGSGEEICTITLWNGSPLSVTAPNFVLLQVAQTDPGVRGDTATGGLKPATLETGTVVRLPLFIELGEIVKIDTRTGEYVERAKE